MDVRLAIGGLLVSLVVLDLFAARAIMRSGWFTRGQIMAQILIVLFVPLFGAIFALVFLRSQRLLTQRAEGSSPDNWQNDAGVHHPD